MAEQIKRYEYRFKEPHGLPSLTLRMLQKDNVTFPVFYTENRVRVADFVCQKLYDHEEKKWLKDITVSTFNPAAPYEPPPEISR